jgi:chromosome segregation ATPase
LAIGAGVYLSYKLYESYKNAQAIRTEVAQARQDIAAANEVVDSLEEEVRQACARTESIQRNADEMQDALAEAERRDSAMREQINAQQEQMEAQRESFARFTSFTTDLAERLRICAEEAQASARSIAEEAEISMKQTLESLGELNADVGLQIDGAQGLIEEGFAEINRLVDLQKELLAAGTEAYRNAAPGEEREGAARLCESVGRAVEINFQISQKANDLHRATRGALDNVKITVVNHVQKLTQEALEHGANLAVKVSELGRAQMSEQNLQMELSALDAEFHRESRAWSRDRARISELDEAISERTTLLAQCHERIRDIRGEVNMLSGNLAKIEGNNSKLSQITANLESHMGEIDRRTSVASNGIEWPVVLGGILGAGIMGGTAALTGIGAGAAVAWVAQRCGVLEMIVPDFNDFTLQFTADDRHSFGET